MRAQTRTAKVAVNWERAAGPSKVPAPDIISGIVRPSHRLATEILIKTDEFITLIIIISNY